MRIEDVEDLWPLAPLQQGMLFDCLAAEPSAGAYVQQVSCTLSGALDAEALKRAWQCLADRHAALRTAFVHEGVAEPVQVVCRSVEVPLRRRDLRGLAADEQQRQIAALEDADRRRGFALHQAPLMRIELMQTGGASWRLFWTHHHLVLDGWSVALLLGEMAALYRGLAGGEAAALAAAPRPYRDYLAWLEEQDRGRAEAYWRGRLAGLHAATPLPLARGGPLGGSARRPAHGEMERRLTPQASADLAAAARRLQLTAGTLMLGAWALLLARYAGADEVVFGLVTAGRPATLSGAERMVGLFINTLPVRVGLRWRSPARQWLHDLQLEQAEMRQHEHTPLHRIKAWSDVPGAAPLFETLLDCVTYPDSATGAGGDLRLSGFRLAERISSPLALVMVPGEQLLLRSYFDAARLDRAEMARLLGHLEMLLGELAAGAELELASLSMLTAGEAQQLAVEWPAGAPSAAVATTLYGRFAEHAARTPDAVAVSGPAGAALSYGELARRAHRLARRLERRGVRRGSRVAICLEPGGDLVVAMLAVLAAGAAYVPVDPRYPRERQTFLLADAQVAAVLTDRQGAGALPPADCPVLEVAAGAQDTVVEDAAAGAERRDPALAGAAATPQETAYVIYTSGSTGRPKGVLVSHANVVRLFGATAAWFGFAADDAWSLFHSFAFDFSVWEIWGALLHGGRVVVVPEAVRQSPDEVLDLLAAERVTVLSQTPLAFYQLAAAQAARPRPLALRQVIFGGEALDPGRLGGWIEQQGDVRPRLVNMYGITETTVHVTYKPLSAADLAPGGSPIGVAIPDLAVHLLDPWRRPVPIGVAGEIHVGGAGVASGYHRRADLTAERFVPDPSGGAGARLYRSGDLARWTERGELEFMGRADDQVKVRGYRIELGEIEAALAAHPRLRAAAVVAHREPGGHARLVAYYVPAAPPHPGAAELLEFLAASLPAPLLPAAFVQLAALPRTAHGKVDRRALPAPGTRSELAAPYRPPASREETLLAALWAEVLGLDRVGIDDDFFNLGGDSILCIQVVARARESGIDLRPAQLFERPTIAQLAAGLASRPRAAAAEQGPVTGQAPLAPIQAWFFAQQPADPHHYNQAVLLDVAAAPALPRLRAALGRLLVHHDALRLRFALRAEEAGAAPVWRQWFAAAPESDGPVAEIDLTGLPAGAQRGAVESGAAALQAGLELSAGPLLRAALWRLGRGEPDRLLLAVHHLAVDAVSWRLLLADLDRLWRDPSAALPPKTTSWREWAERSLRRAEAVEVEAELGYWLAAARQRVLPLPRDGAEADDTVGRAASLRGELEAAPTAALLRRVPESSRVQVEEVLLAALAQALAEWSGRRRLLVDLETHGRDETIADPPLDLSRTVGWFTALFPLLIDLEGAAAGAGGLLKAVKQQRRSVPGRGLGYGLLRYLAGAETARRLQRLPAAEVAFNYLGQLDAALPSGASLAPSSWRAGPMQSARQRRAHRLEVVAWVDGGRLRVEITYGSRVHSRATVERLCTRLLAALRELVAHCLERGACLATPADFPLAALGQPELDLLVAELGAGERLADLYPLSPMQQGMLFHAVLGPADGLYVQHLGCTLEGDLDLATFEAACARLLAWHAILRTAFRWQGFDEPLQLVLESGAALRVSIQLVDLRSLVAASHPGEIDRLLRDNARRGFDLARPPLLRIYLVQLEARLYRLIWTHHHILLDGWSRARIVAQLLAAYAELRRGGEPRRVAGAAFRDYVGWLLAQDLDEARRFWQACLEGFAGPTPLPGGSGAAAVTAAAAGPERHRQAELRLSERSTAALQALARGHGVTLNVLMQGAWGLLLARHGATSDVVFGAIVSGRSVELPGVESMIGVLMNAQPVRLKVQPRQRLLAWLRALQESQARAHRYEFVPLSAIQGWTGAGADRPLFETLFVFENFPLAETLGTVAGAGLRLREPAGAGAVGYPLTLVIEPERELLLLARFDSSRLGAAAVQGLLADYQALLAAILDDPGAELGSLVAVAEPATDLGAFNEALEEV